MVPFDHKGSGFLVVGELLLDLDKFWVILVGIYIIITTCNKWKEIPVVLPFHHSLHTSGKMNTPARRRLMRDFKRLQNDPPEGISGAPNGNNILQWQAVIFG